MKRHVLIAAAIAACLSAPGHAAAQSVTRQVKKVNGVIVDKFAWLDSSGRRRTVSLKREGEGNPGHGGYAVQMSYQYKDGNVWKTAVVNPQTTTKNPYEGFGYFVAHERYRKFADGDSATIAGKVFKTDDSPRGLDFPVTIINPTSAYPKRKAIQYLLNYPKYGTNAAHGGLDDNGEDTPRLPTRKSFYRLYQLPVRITWYFESGKDYPRIRNQVSLENVPGPDRVSFDMRGPYGAMNFDEDTDASLMRVTWNDRFEFYSNANRNVPLTRNSRWDWHEKLTDTAARYSSLATSTAEMGLVEPVAYIRSNTRDGYSGARGLTVAQYDNANGGCAGQKLPCDYEWPYQSAQYSLPADPNTETTGRKIAWGTTPFYGMSLSTVYDSPTTSQPFVGFPESKQLIYDVCVVLAKNYNEDGLDFYSKAKRVAVDAGTYNCARTKLQ